MSDYNENRIQEFIDALYDAGWNAPNDAQHHNIMNIYESYVQDSNIDYMQQEISRLKGAVEMAYRQGHADGWKELEVDKGFDLYMKQKESGDDKS